MKNLLLNLAGLAFCIATLAQPSANLEAPLQAIRNVGPEGRGNPAATRAWETISRAGLSQLPQILGAMDESNPLANNWLRVAADVVLDRQLQAGQPFPTQTLGLFVLDASHAPQARNLAFEWLERAQPETARRLVPGLLNDPSVDLRRRAVAQLLDQADQCRDRQPDDATLLYRQALAFARDVRQIRQASGELKKLGQTVDLPRHFGFLMRWKIIGPFDNAENRGFETAYPPETEIDFTAQYPGKNGSVGWIDFVTSHPYGIVDINRAYGPLKETTAYACAEFHADAARPAQLRLGCKNGWKVWFNGQFLFGRDEYHRGMAIDQYILPIQLQPGENIILVKLCQNELVEEWTREWQFQLRICDATGSAILSTRRLPTPETGTNLQNTGQKEGSHE